MNNYLLKTERLGFRPWKDSDLAPFAAINASPLAMQYFPRTYTTEESQQMIEYYQRYFDEHGFCVYAIDLLATNSFIGYLGFAMPNFESFFTPCVEIGWRFSPSIWNQGLATEGALACLDYGFNELGFERIHSFTATQNIPSERVMQKIGMEKIGEFEHPKLALDDPLCRHVLYCKENTTIHF